MSDLISRQAAIDAVHNLYVIFGIEGEWVDRKDVFGAINSLPSAQPEHEVRFFDADHVWIDHKQFISLQRFGEAVKDAQPQRTEERTETHACDCVSGVAAIVAAIEAVDEWDGGYNVQRANMIRDAIKALPSAQPQRIKGKWERKESDLSWWYECSECGESPLFDPYEHEVRTPFCPWCGAEMETEGGRG